MSTFVPWLHACISWLDVHNGAITAFATFVIALFTILLAFVSGHQARLIRRQISLAREELTTTSRAFVFIDGFNYILFTREDQEGPGKVDVSELTRSNYGPKELERRLIPTFFSVQPRWKNAGSTPTKKMTTKVNWKWLESALEPGFDFAYTDQPERHFLGPKATEASTHIEIPAIYPFRVIAFQCGMPSIASIGANDYARYYPSIIVWGHADYWDVFDKPHFVEWCYQMGFYCPDSRKLTVSFTQCGGYNRTDEDADQQPGRDPGSPPN